MKRFLFLIFTAILLFASKGQDELPGVFILSNGIEKIDAITQLQGHSNITDIKRWNDKQVNYVHNQNFIIGDNENVTILVFEQDKLWEQDLRVFYDPKKANECVTKFKDIVTEFYNDKKFEVTKFKFTDPDTHEKIGEGIDVFDKKKPNFKLEISYTIHYSSDKSIDRYDFEIIYFDYKYAPNDAKQYLLLGKPSQ